MKLGWEAVDWKEKAWRLQQERLAAAIPSEMSYVHIHRCVLGQEQPPQSLELSQFHQSGKQTKDKGLRSLCTRTREQQ